MSRALALLLLVLAGCAHGRWSAGVAHDDRAVLAAFGAAWCEPCRQFDREYLTDPELQRALRGVRFVRYDIDSLGGQAAYRLIINREPRQVPMFAGLPDGEHPWFVSSGLPPRRALVDLVDQLARTGGSEAELGNALIRAPRDPDLLERAALWYSGRRRRSEAVDAWARILALSNAPERLRAEAEWQVGIHARKGAPRDPRAPLTFVLAHPASPHAPTALSILAVISNLSAEDVAAALRAVFQAHRQDGDTVNELAYAALAAHQYDVALELAQQTVRLRKDAQGWDTMAEVYYYRHEAEMAISLGERAVALEPKNERLRANLARFRRADGTSSPQVEHYRTNGYLWLPRFYGDVD